MHVSWEQFCDLFYVYCHADLLYVLNAGSADYALCVVYKT